MTRSSFRARRKEERGFAIISAIVLAFLFFSLIALVLIESTATAQQASRFRSRVAADALAESAAEIAVYQMLAENGRDFETEIEEGFISASWQRTASQVPDIEDFELVAKAKTKGVPPVERTVELYGKIQGSQVTIVRTVHAP